MKYINTYNVSVDFLPWFESGWRFSSLSVTESIGGELPFGRMILEDDGSKKATDMALNMYTGVLKIKKEDEKEYTLNIFIIDRNYYLNFLSISFIVCNDRKFFTETECFTYNSGIEEVIKTLYPGKVEYRDNLKSDVDPELEFFQNNESKHNLCRKLCHGFKYNSVFAFGFEGLLIKETVSKDSLGQYEPYWEIIGGIDHFQVTPYDKKYCNFIYTEPSNPWLDNTWEEDYTDREAKNPAMLMDRRYYKIFGRDFTTIHNNIMFNSRLYDSNMYTSTEIVLRNFPKYKICDVISYHRAEEDPKDLLPFDHYLIKSNTLFIAVEGSDKRDEHGLSFSWTTELLGLDYNKTLLPLVDPAG